jgi:hypothetical protein
LILFTLCQNITSFCNLHVILLLISDDAFIKSLERFWRLFEDLSVIVDKNQSVIIVKLLLNFLYLLD